MTYTKDVSYEVRFREQKCKNVLSRHFKSQSAAREFYKNLGNVPTKVLILNEQTMLDFEKND